MPNCRAKNKINNITDEIKYIEFDILTEQQYSTDIEISVTNTVYYSMAEKEALIETLSSGTKNEVENNNSIGMADRTYDDYDNYRPNPYFATSSRYDYMYANPPRHSLGAYGRYIHSSSKVRYVHSPSRLKGAKHAARINAYNMQAYNY